MMSLKFKYESEKLKRGSEMMSQFGASLYYLQMGTFFLD
jgi:hypothetical protein